MEEIMEWLTHKSTPVSKKNIDELYQKFLRYRAIEGVSGKLFGDNEKELLEIKALKLDIEAKRRDLGLGKNQDKKMTTTEKGVTGALAERLSEVSGQSKDRGGFISQMMNKQKKLGKQPDLSVMFKEGKSATDFLKGNKSGYSRLFRTLLTRKPRF